MNQVLLEKWDGLINTDKADTITDKYRRKVTAQLLENQEKFLQEASASSVTSNVQNWDPVLIGLVRRMAPKLIAYDLCSVQPMSGPTGLIFAMRSKYDRTGDGVIGVSGVKPRYTKPGASGYVGSQTVDEALHFEADTSFSGTGTHADPYDPYSDNFVPANTYGTAMLTATAETDDSWNSMSMTIEKVSVTARTRQLRADYSIEMAQDLKTMHGLDADSEITNMLSTEIVAEINREITRTIYGHATVGAQWSGIDTPGIFDLDNDADGRWSLEKYKGLMFAIERDANKISLETRRGKGNILLTSADVASALNMAGVLNYTNMSNGIQMEVDVTGVTFAGMMGRFKVFVDPYLSNNGVTVGYKGTNVWDAGIYYAPYVPLQLFRATNVDNFQPAMGFKTRYGLVANPFTNSDGVIQGAVSPYYRRFAVRGL